MSQSYFQRGPEGTDTVALLPPSASPLSEYCCTGSGNLMQDSLPSGEKAVAKVPTAVAVDLQIIQRQHGKMSGLAGLFIELILFFCSTSSCNGRVKPLFFCALLGAKSLSLESPETTHRPRQLRPQSRAASSDSPSGLSCSQHSDILLSKSFS